MISQHFKKACSALFRSGDHLPYKKYKNCLDYIAAQWALESGWGRSTLASLHNNFGGMKYRQSIENEHTKKIVYVDRFGDSDHYFSIDLPEHYYLLYFAFVGRERYKNVRLDCGFNFVHDLANCGYVAKMHNRKGEIVPDERLAEFYAHRVQEIVLGKTFQRLLIEIKNGDDELPDWLNLIL